MIPTRRPYISRARDGNALVTLRRWEDRQGIGGWLQDAYAPRREQEAHGTPISLSTAPAIHSTAVEQSWSPFWGIATPE